MPILETGQFQYQIKTEAPPGALSAIPRLESWHQPLASPVRFKRISVALIASGLIAPVLTPAQIIIPLSTWRYGWSEPVRLKKGLRPQLQQTTAFVNPVFRLDVRLMRYPAWAEPVRQKKGLKSQLQQSFTWPPRTLPVPDITLIMNATETNNDIFLGAMRVVNAAADVRVSIKEVIIPSVSPVSIRES